MQQHIFALVRNGNLGNYYSLSGGIAIPEGADLNDYKTPGNYYCLTGSVANTLKNCPFESAFVMKIEYSNGVDWPRQTYKQIHSPKIITRSFSPSTNQWSTDNSYVTNSDLKEYFPTNYSYVKNGTGNGINNLMLDAISITSDNRRLVVYVDGVIIGTISISKPN